MIVFPVALPVPGIVSFNCPAYKKGSLELFSLWVCTFPLRVTWLQVVQTLGTPLSFDVAQFVFNRAGWLFIVH